MRTHATFRVLLLPILGALASCGGGGGGGGGNSGGGFGGGAGSGGTWQAGVFKPSANYDNMCANPRAGTADRQGTRTDENNWLRACAWLIAYWRCMPGCTSKLCMTASPACGTGLQSRIT